MMFSVLAVQAPSSPFLPEPLTRRPSTASENVAGWRSFVILVVEVILTLTSLFLTLRVRIMLVLSMLEIMPL